MDASVRALIATHELERQRIARDLHDVVGQALTAVRLHLALIRRDPSRIELVSFEADQAIDLVDAALRQVRELAFEIRPAILDDLGLIAAARSCLARQARISGFLGEFEADVPEFEVEPETEAACFRTLQEALTNVSRHAAATSVVVRLVASGGELVLEVADDGIGFDTTRIRDGERSGSSLGLLGLWERIVLVGGDLVIRSAPGEGTMIRAVFPRHDDFVASRSPLTGRP